MRTHTHTRSVCLLVAQHWLLKEEQTGELFLFKINKNLSLKYLQVSCVDLYCIKLFKTAFCLRMASRGDALLRCLLKLLLDASSDSGLSDTVRQKLMNEAALCIKLLDDCCHGNLQVSLPAGGLSSLRDYRRCSDAEFL